LAIARIVQTEVTPAQYDQMVETLGVGSTPPPGGVLHVAVVGENGKVRIVEVWDTREQAEAWGDKVAAVREAAGIGTGPPPVEYLEVHNVIQR
jgi:hypothetical protein